MEILRWKFRGLVGSEVAVFQDKLLIGMLKNSVWSSRSYGEIRGRLLRFERKRRYSGTFIIKDIEGVGERGRIDFRWFRRKIAVELDGKHYTWERMHWFGNSFSIVSDEGESLEVRGGTIWGRSGSLHLGYIDPALVLVGFYIMEIIRKVRR